MQLTKTFHSLHFFIELPVRTENPVGLPILTMGFQHLVLNHDNILFNHIKIDKIDTEDFLKWTPVGCNDFELLISVFEDSTPG